MPAARMAEYPVLEAERTDDAGESLKQAVAGAKTVDELNAIHDRYAEDPGFLHRVIEMMDTNSLQRGASWLLKQHCARHGDMSERDASSVLARLPDLEHWESRLHLLQCLPYMPIAERDKRNVENFLRHCLTENNKFVRAWAYSGFHELAARHPEYAEESRRFFQMALRDEAPSVKARIRKLLKQV